MSETRPAFNGLTLVIVQEDGKTLIQAQHPHPVPEQLQFALQSSDSQLWSDSVDEQGFWQEQTDEQGLLMEYVVPGVYWAMARAVRWCRQLDRSFGRTLAIYQRVKDHDNAAPYPMRFVFLGQVCDTFKQMDKLYQQMPLTSHVLGSFELTQPTLRVTDPCYDVDTWCAGTTQALPGKWTAQSLIGPTDWDSRTHLLQIHHESVQDAGIRKYADLEKLDIHAGVDSGQCGFFDDALYPRDAASFEYEDGTFYGDCCSSTLSEALPGGNVVRNMGAVTSSGFGDGGYNVYVERNANGDIVLAQLLFIGDTADEEDDEDEEAVAE